MGLEKDFQCHQAPKLVLRWWEGTLGGRLSLNPPEPEHPAGLPPAVPVTSQGTPDPGVPSHQTGCVRVPPAVPKAALVGQMSRPAPALGPRVSGSWRFRRKNKERRKDFQLSGEQKSA